jgi:hypothetical protein
MLPKKIYVWGRYMQSPIQSPHHTEYRSYMMPEANYERPGLSLIWKTFLFNWHMSYILILKQSEPVAAVPLLLTPLVCTTFRGRQGVQRLSFIGRHWHKCYLLPLEASCDHCLLVPAINRECQEIKGGVFSSHPKTLHPIPWNVWRHAWSIKYR